MSALQWIITACSVLSTAVSCLYLIRGVYAVVGAVRTRHFPPAKTAHRYGILIAARNEEAVIGALLDSIAAQQYPADKIQVFVVADNCAPTDRTAAIARAHGAACYERHDPTRATKGWALNFLLTQIRRDYGIGACDGYFVFDADNRLAPDYIARMNDAFDAGEKIVTSYRLASNFFANWISFTYGVHWLSTVRLEHRGRSVLRLATRIQGTGYLFAAEVVRGGWPYTSLTEDRAFAADAVVNGYRISYCDDAVFTDEQPVGLRIALRQRIRWAKGHLPSFGESCPKLLRELIRSRDFDRRVMCYDMALTVFPESLVYLALSLVSTAALLGLWVMGDPSALAAAARNALLTFFVPCAMPLYVLLAERRRIRAVRPASGRWKTVGYILMWPFFALIGTAATAIALVTRVEWKPIPHTGSLELDNR